MAERLRDRGRREVEWRVWYQEPAPAIAEAASEGGAELIVMSTHGRGGLGRLLVGSVAEAVVRQAQVPVLLVRGALAPRPAGLGRVLVPLDGSEQSETVLGVVGRLAGPLDLGVDLLHVIEPLSPSATAEIALHVDEITRLRQKEADARLAQLRTGLEGRGLRVRYAVRHGAVVDVIERYAAEESVGLIAMATHGRTGLPRLLFGSVAERCLRQARVPVLLWKAPAEVGPGSVGR